MSTAQKHIVATKTTCHHCGEDCSEQTIWQLEKAFCCQGCLMVFQILEENGLDNFYKIQQAAGISLKNQKIEKYEWLNDVDIFEQLIDYEDDKKVKVRFYLPQIHCSACIYLLENLYKLSEGIIQSKVHFLKKEIQIDYDKSKTNLQQLAQLLASIGYAPEINFSDLAEDKKPFIDKTLAYQLGIAGLAFWNIMLLSFPEYLGLEEAIFQQVFGYLNIALALPVLLYSGRSYWQSAWQGIRQRHLNIDVPITLGMLTLFGRSLFEILTSTGAGYLDSLAGLVFFLLIGKWFQQKTYHRLSFERDYKSYFPIVANLIKNGKMIATPIDKLQIGDCIFVKHKELIPADGILEKGRARIDYSFVTGESATISKNIKEKLYAGGRQMGDGIEIRLTKRVAQSYLTQLWNDEAFTKSTKQNTQKIADVIGKYFTYAILGIAFLTLFYWLPKDLPLAINAFTAVLIIACPCAIALAIPFTLGNTLQLFSKHGFYLKNTTVIEQLVKISSIVFDKTGTLTVNSAKDLIFEGNQLNQIEKEAIRSLTQQSNHPISQKIACYFRLSKTIEVFDFEEIIGKGIRGFANGLFIEITKNEGKQKGTVLKINGVEKGIFTLKNQYRNGFINLITNWKKQFQLFVLSGDNETEKMHLQQIFPSQNLHFNQSPKDKLQFIKTLQKNGEKVLMFGDGLNDSGALQQSDVGIVITENTNNFTPASDAILDAKNFRQLPALLNFARKSIRVVYWSYGLALIYNIIGLSYAVKGALSPVIAAILMPLSSVTIVAFGVGLTSWMVTKITTSP